MQEVTVRASATVANVVCGFDCLGFALSEPFDELTVRKIGRPGISITSIDDFGLTTDPEKNVAGAALISLMTAAGESGGIEIISNKKIKPGSGIGSSAASAAAAVVAGNHLLETGFTDTELVRFAMDGEVVASGSRHADNVAPCIFGGFVLVRSADPLDIVRLEHPKLWVTVLHPQIEVRTSEARAILPRQVPLKDAVTNWSNLGAFVASLATNDQELMGRAMRDVIVEPARSSLIPGFEKIRSAALDAGAIGGGISGSGPSIFMLSSSRRTASLVEAAMADIFNRIGHEFNTYVGTIESGGVRVIDAK